MTRKIKDTIKQAALWVVAVTATMFIVCSVMGGRLTPMDALNMFGCFRLSARIAGPYATYAEAEEHCHVLNSHAHNGARWTIRRKHA